jgi:hypothetical protein
MKAAVETDSLLSVPAGVYRVSDLALRDRLRIDGAGRSTTWIRGHVTFGSDSQISDLKIGDRGVSAVHNRAGASNTVFTSCRFRGGGGKSWTYVVDLGSGAACSHITFRDCSIERNLGVDVDGRRGFNNIAIWVGKGAPVTDITLEDCRIGVSNGGRGRAKGAPRMGLECFVDPAASVPWSNITLRDCVFAAADGHSADFSDQPFARATGLLIEGCTFKGGGLLGRWGWTLVLEMPLNPVVRNNTFYRGKGNWGYVLAVVDRGDSTYGTSGATITGNAFDLDTDNGIAPSTTGWPFVLNGYDNTFAGNTVRCHYGARHMLVLDHAYRNVVTGNTLKIGNRPLATQINGSSGNTVTANTVH